MASLPRQTAEGIRHEPPRNGRIALGIQRANGPESSIMRYLIVGCGRVGSTLARRLMCAGHEITVVDENPSAFRRLGRNFHGQQVLGTGIDVDVLTRAGAGNADGFAAVTQGDNRNIMAALIAQAHFKIKKVVARIYDPERSQMYRDF